MVEKPEIYKKIPRRYKRFGLPQNVFLEFLSKQQKPDVILMTCGMTYWYTGVWEIVQLCKKYLNVPVILGGTYPTFCPEHAKKSGADIIFQGANIKGFVDIFNSKTSLPLKYFDNLKPFWQVYEKLSYLVVRTSYGCPFSCWYCGIKKMYPEYQLRKAEIVVDEVVENMQRYSIKDIAFYDDGLFCNFSHLEKIVEKIAAVKKVNFHTPNGVHTGYIDREIAIFLKEKGFKTLRLSVESFDEKRQKESSFKISFSYFERAMKNLVDAGFSKNEIGVYILAGLPGQTPDDVIRTVKKLKEFPCKIKIAEYSPIPGTIDFEISKNLYPDINLDEPLNHNNSIFPLWNFENKWEKIAQMKNFCRD